MTDEEKDFYEKYIKPQYTILKRIKRKIFKPSKRIKTIDDFDFLDYDLFVKLICILMIYFIVRMLALGLIDIYRWFFPAKELITQSPFFRYISTASWILIANTGPTSITNYYTLGVTLIAILTIIVGLIGIIRGSRKKETDS